MREAKSEERRWLSIAETHLEAAGYALDLGLHRWASFSAHVAVENALKAFLFSKGERRAVSHSIAELRQISSKYDKMFMGLVSTSKLDTFYTLTRYPMPNLTSAPESAPLAVYDPVDAEEAIGLATEVMETVRPLLGEQDDG